jgi:tight adherence protein B
MILPIALVVGALTLFAAAVGFWRSVGVKSRRAAATHLERQLALQAEQRVSKDKERTARLHARTGWIAWDHLLVRAGILPTAAFHLKFIVFNIGIAAVVLLFTGPIAAVAALILTCVLSVFRIWHKGNSRRRRMVEQLPLFLDAMVRLITIGNSTGAAFQGALANVNEPLREVLDRADSLSRSGVEIDLALRQVANLYDLHELRLVSAIVSVALRFGGRSDQVLDRMAGFMRDVEQARNELHALSAEVRLSAWILALLPLGLALFIIIFNNGLFMGMWRDSQGFKMLMGAVLLQIGGSIWLYRMVKAFN